MTQDTLPEPIRRFLETAYPDGPPSVETVLIEGRGTLRRRPLPRLPFSGRVSVVPGSARVMDLAVGLGRVTLLRGLDAYVDGRGFTRVGRRIDAGPELDQGAFHTLVIETITFPASWSSLGLAWEPIDARTARVEAPLGDGVEAATVRFDPATSFPSAYETLRHKGRGPKVEWHVGTTDWLPFGSVWEPRGIAVRWLDEPDPWFRMRIERVEPGADVRDALARARSALATAGA